MANPKTPETEIDLREEFNELRAQVNDLVKALKSKSEEKAVEKIHEAYEFGDASLDEFNDRIRKNPVSSITIAFLIGYVVSKILGQNK